MQENLDFSKEKADNEKLFWDSMDKMIKVPEDINENYIGERLKILINDLTNMNGVDKDTLLYSKEFKKHTIILIILMVITIVKKVKIVS
jgi:hypothetical protein